MRLLWKSLPDRKLRAISDTRQGIRDEDFDDVIEWLSERMPGVFRLEFNVWKFETDEQITMFLLVWQ